MVGRFSINAERAWIVIELPPSLQGLIGTDRSSIHGDSVGQQTKHCEPRQKTSSHGPIGLLVPPALRDFIGSMALNQPTPILDGNVIRVLTRLFAIKGDPRDKAVNSQLWALAEDLVSIAARTSDAANTRTPSASARMIRKSEAAKFFVLAPKRFFSSSYAVKRFPRK